MLEGGLPVRRKKDRGAPSILILIIHQERKYFVENKTGANNLSDLLKVIEPVSSPAGMVDA